MHHMTAVWHSFSDRPTSVSAHGYRHAWELQPTCQKFESPSGNGFLGFWKPGFQKSKEKHPPPFQKGSAGKGGFRFLLAVLHCLQSCFAWPASPCVRCIDEQHHSHQ
jgi:hypothetical protein